MKYKIIGTLVVLGVLVLVLVLESLHNEPPDTGTDQQQQTTEQQ